MTTIKSSTYGLILAHRALRPTARLEDILSELHVSLEDLRRDEPAILQELAGSWTARKGSEAMKFAEAAAKAIQCRRPKKSAGFGTCADAAK